MIIDYDRSKLPEVIDLSPDIRLVRDGYGTGYSAEWRCICDICDREYWIPSGRVYGCGPTSDPKGPPHNRLCSRACQVVHARELTRLRVQRCRARARNAQDSGPA